HWSSGRPSVKIWLHAPPPICLDVRTAPPGPSLPPGSRRERVTPGATSSETASVNKVTGISNSFASQPSPSRQSGRPATIDRDGRAGHERRSIRGQEGGYLGLFFGLPGPSERGLLHHRLQCLLGDGPVELGISEPRCHDIGPNALPAIFHRHGLG